MEEVLTLLQCIGFALCILLVEPLFLWYLVLPFVSYWSNLTLKICLRYLVLPSVFNTLALPFVLSWFVSPSWPNLTLLLFTLLFQANANISCCLISLTQEQILFVFIFKMDCFLFVFIIDGLFSIYVYLRWIVSRQKGHDLPFPPLGTFPSCLSSPRKYSPE